MAKKKKTQSIPDFVKRPPIVAVMGHIDHGKSTLLDTIRKTNTVAGEAGGITQHISAYVTEHTTSDGATESITFLDTPGHEAFQEMRKRGATVADVAILVVSAEDGIKPQTVEALESIKSAGIPYVVAINKIDVQNANVERTKASCVEHEIYLEGMGGDVPYAAVSAKSGEGIRDLLDVVVLAADFAELTGDRNAPAEGIVIESKLDPRRGTTATLIVKNGTLKSGSFVVTETAYAPVRIMEDFTGTSIKEAGLSAPVALVGFSEMPHVGDTFKTVDSKKEAEATLITPTIMAKNSTPTEEDVPTVPVVIKADVQGSLDAIKHELQKLTTDRIAVQIVTTGVGDVTPDDIHAVGASEHAIVIGFNVAVTRAAADSAERFAVTVATFDIIYNLTEWLEKALTDRTPTREEAIDTGTAKILKHFSVQKHTHVLGARIEDGVLKTGQTVRILRRDIVIGTGTIQNLQQQKSDVKEIAEGEFGMQLTTRADIAPGDHIIAYNTVTT